MFNSLFYLFKLYEYEPCINSYFFISLFITFLYLKHKWPQKMRLDGRSEHEVYVVGVVLVGVLAALALSAAVLYLTRKHGYKLKSHVKSEGEPMSKLYQVSEGKWEWASNSLAVTQVLTLQDLCRARMSTKTTGEKETAPSQRITSLSKESDKDSPSSRSSTSSWLVCKNSTPFHSRNLSYTMEGFFSYPMHIKYYKQSQAIM